MQLDRTHLAVRERNGFEILDMSLHVLRTYFRAWWQATLLGALPFMLINVALLWGLWTNDDEEFPSRYVYLMTVLIFIEAPWATAVLTTYLGAAVFDEKMNVRAAWRETWKRLPQLVWCQGILRGVLPAIGLIVLARQSDRDMNWFLEGFLLIMLGLYVVAIRAFRPFINEILLLERNPVRAKSSQVITAGKRSKWLHDPSGGDLVLRWIAAAIVSILLALAFTQTLTVTSGVFFGRWNWGWFMLLVGFPLLLWLVSGFMAIVRFLNYLDLRIRHEGWEVELRLRAEAVRLANKLS